MTSLNPPEKMAWVNCNHLLLALLVAVLVPVQLEAAPKAAPGSVLNPDISSNFAMVAGGSSEEEEASIPGTLPTGIFIQEMEVRLGANADPFFRFDVALTAHTHNGELELTLEEASLSTLALPDTTLRAGKFLLNFGKANLAHAHSRRFIDAPPVLGWTLNTDHLLGTGISLDYLVPLPFFVETNFQVVHLESRDHDHGHEEERQEAEELPGRSSGLSLGGHLKTFFDLSDSLTWEMGLSGLLGPEEEGDRLMAWGGDLTLKWVPTDSARYTSLEWITEYMASASGGTKRDGLYTGVRYQRAQRWTFQLRGSVLDLAKGGSGSGIVGNALIGFAPSERTAIRLQYTCDLKGETTEHHHGGEGHQEHSDEIIHGLFMQLVVSIGPHPAHTY